MKRKFRVTSHELIAVAILLMVNCMVSAQTPPSAQGEYRF